MWKVWRGELLQWTGCGFELTSLWRKIFKSFLVTVMSEVFNVLRMWIVDLNRLFHVVDGTS